MTFFIAVVSSQLHNSRLSDVVLFGVLCKFSHNFFSIRVSPPWMVSPGAVRPPCSDAAFYPAANGYFCHGLDSLMSKSWHSVACFWNILAYHLYYTRNSRIFIHQNGFQTFRTLTFSYFSTQAFRTPGNSNLTLILNPTSNFYSTNPNPNPRYLT